MRLSQLECQRSQSFILPVIIEPKNAKHVNRKVDWSSGVTWFWFQQDKSHPPPFFHPTLSTNAKRRDPFFSFLLMVWHSLSFPRAHLLIIKASMSPVHQSKFLSWRHSSLLTASPSLQAIYRRFFLSKIEGFFFVSAKCASRSRGVNVRDWGWVAETEREPEKRWWWISGQTGEWYHSKMERLSQEFLGSKLHGAA